MKAEGRAVTQGAEPTVVYQWSTRKDYAISFGHFLGSSNRGPDLGVMTPMAIQTVSDQRPIELAQRLRLRQLPEPRRAQAIRVAAGATQAELAEAIGVHVVTVARWEAGFCRPRGATAGRYAEVLRQLGDVAG